MASGLTNRGKMLLLKHVFPQTESLPSNFYLALVTDSLAPDADTNVLGDLTEIAAGNGYTSGGMSITPNGTNFVVAEDDTNDKGTVTIADKYWTASGGSVPASGDGARYAVLLDDNGVVANRQVYAFFDLGADYSISDGQNLLIKNAAIEGRDS